MNIHWIHCIENFFTVQHFWTTCTCPEEQSFPWKFSLYWLYTFYHTRFLINLRLLWKTELPWNSLLYWNTFIIQDFWATYACPENRVSPEIFHCIDYTFYIQDFWATCTCPEKQSCLEIFHFVEISLSFSNFEQLALAQKFFSPPPHRLVRLWVYGIEDENIILHITWKTTISKRHKWALCPLNGLCLLGSKIRGYYYYKKRVYVQVIRSTARRYFRERQHGPAWKCLYPKNKPTKTLEIVEIYRRELLNYTKEL